MVLFGRTSRIVKKKIVCICLLLIKIEKYLYFMHGYRYTPYIFTDFDLSNGEKDKIPTRSSKGISSIPKGRQEYQLRFN